MPPKHQYPPLYEKLVPVILGILAITLAVLLIGIVVVVLFSGAR